MDDHAKEVIQKVQDLVKLKYNGDYAAAFAHYDLDHNGKLGHKDLMLLLEDCNVGMWLTRSTWANGIIAQLDSNHDGAVSIPELTLAMVGQAIP